MHVAPGRAAWDMPGRTSLHPEWWSDLHTCKTNLGSWKKLSVGWSFAWGLCDMLEDYKQFFLTIFPYVKPTEQ